MMEMVITMSDGDESKLIAIEQLMGPASMGQHTKMVNQILISTTMIGVVEGLLYGYKAGLNLEEVIKVVCTMTITITITILVMDFQVGAGAAGSW